MIEPFKYLVVFVVGALIDLLTNKIISPMKNLTGGLAGLQSFYSSIPWYSAMLWAGLLFALVYFISDWVYNLIRPSLPRQYINVHPNELILI